MTKKSHYIEEIFTRFSLGDANPKPELVAPNAYCFLVCVVLSAQATDKSVNLATKPLFEKVKTPEEMLSLGRGALISYIKSIGLYNSKADHIIALSQKLIEEFDSKVPDDAEKLMALPGVGRKTANVVLNVVFGKATVPVDTHVFRVSHRLSLSEGKSPELVEKDLLKIVPEKFLKNAHHWLLLHGRYTCTARNPKCSECILKDLCPQGK